MSAETERVSSSDVYKKRFKEYGSEYINSWPEPEVPEGTNADLGVAKTALKRSVRYNDKDTTKSVQGDNNGDK
jgi:hypothetical protein